MCCVIHVFPRRQWLLLTTSTEAPTQLLPRAHCTTCPHTSSPPYFTSKSPPHQPPQLAGSLQNRNYTDQHKNSKNNKIEEILVFQPLCPVTPAGAGGARGTRLLEPEGAALIFLEFKFQERRELWPPAGDFGGKQDKWNCFTHILHFIQNTSWHVVSTKGRCEKDEFKGFFLENKRILKTKKNTNTKHPKIDG